MSVLIKGMERPKSCEKCQFFVWSLGVGQHCAVAPNITFYAVMDGMDVSYKCYGDCPLIEMTLEDLKTEADNLGYRLVPKRANIKLLPCSCGCNRRTTWWTYDGLFYECKNCGKRSAVGGNSNEAKRLWNQMIEQEENT